MRIVTVGGQELMVDDKGEVLGPVTATKAAGKGAKAGKAQVFVPKEGTFKEGHTLQLRDFPYPTTLGWGKIDDVLTHLDDVRKFHAKYAATRGKIAK